MYIYQVIITAPYWLCNGLRAHLECDSSGVR